MLMRSTISEKVFRFLHQSSLSNYEIARLTGLTHTTVSKLRNSKTASQLGSIHTNTASRILCLADYESAKERLHEYQAPTKQGDAKVK